MLARDLSDDHRARGSWQVRDRGMYPDVVQRNPSMRTQPEGTRDFTFLSPAVSEASQINRPNMHLLNEFLAVLATAIAVADTSDDEELAEGSIVHLSSLSASISRPKCGYPWGANCP